MSINHKLESLRVSYQAASLDVQNCHSDPLVQFDFWLHDAINGQCEEPNAFVLSTIANNKPRSRVVLLKGIISNQLVFYTNYLSAKGDELKTNNHVSMTFLWLPLQRQVRIEGTAFKAPSNISDEYFQKRPRGSQIGAIASPQSRKVQNRSELEKIFRETEANFEGVDSPTRPGFWGGYMVIPDYFEFWQGRPNRLHDRICYEKTNQDWDMSRLAP